MRVPQGPFPRVFSLALLMVAGAASDGAAQTDVWLVPILADGAGFGAPIAVAARAGYENQPAFSLDGRRLYFTSTVGDQTDIWALPLDGAGRPAAEAAPLTRTPESEYSATEMPSTDRFSVIRVEADGTQRLWSFGRDGSDPRIVLEDVAPVGYHAWGEGGQVAMFVLGDPATLVLAEVRTGQARTLASNIGRSFHPVPGRNAVSLTERTADGGWWITRLDLPDGQLTRLTRTTGGGQDYAWAPDGSILMADGNRIMRWTEADGWIVRGELPDLADITRMAVHPDGTALVVVAAEPLTERQ